MTDKPNKKKKVFNKSKTKTPMREQAPMDRILNFEEVPLGYNEIEAQQEALTVPVCAQRVFSSPGELAAQGGDHPLCVVGSGGVHAPHCSVILQAWRGHRCGLPG